MSRSSEFHSIFKIRIHRLDDHDIELGIYIDDIRDKIVGADNLFAEISVGALGGMDWTADVYYFPNRRSGFKPDERYNCETVKGDWTEKIFDGILNEYERKKK